MGKNSYVKDLRKRLADGNLSRKDVIRGLGELAFGQANDCVRLVLEDGVDIRGLDLGLLSEVKRSDRGAVEVRLLDRLQALRQLGELTSEDGGDIQQFFRSLQEEA